MQRVRVGVTGLAAIVLVVLLATAITSGVRHSVVNEGGGAPAPVVAPITTPPKTRDANADPLAQLGAAPGGSTEANSQQRPAR
jgi:hypothetical protein